MSKILVIDTTTEACSAALQIGQQIFTRYKVAPRQHGELILPMVDELLTEANVTLAELDVIGYGQGPGAFTGLRICVSIAQGLAYGAELPVVGVSSLQAMAQRALMEQQKAQVLSIIDARMGEVYWAEYQAESGLMVLAGQEIVCEPEQLVLNEGTSNKKYYGVGSGWETYSERLNEHLEASTEQLSIEQEVSFPQAVYMLPWVASQFEKGLATTAELAQPVYLRNNVAKKKALQ